MNTVRLTDGIEVPVSPLDPLDRRTHDGVQSSVLIGTCEGGKRAAFPGQLGRHLPRQVL